MRGWLRRALYAAQLAGDRADLWPAGALAWLAFVGWIPFLVVVARPDPNDLAFIGVSIYTSGAFPLNVIGLAVLALAVFALLCLASATAQVALLRSAAAPDPGVLPSQARCSPASRSSCLRPCPPSAPSSRCWQASPPSRRTHSLRRIRSTPILVRLGAPLLPFLIVFVVALLAGQAFGGTALRLAHQAPGASITTVLGRAGRALLRRPWGAMGVVLGGLLLDVLALVVTSALLSVLWMPIGSALDGGRLGDPGDAAPAARLRGDLAGPAAGGGSGAGGGLCLVGHRAGEARS